MKKNLLSPPSSKAINKHLLNENERLRAEQLRLHRAIRLLQAEKLTNHIGGFRDGLLLEDEQQRIVLVNDQFCRLFAIPLPPQQLTGLDYSGMAQQSKHLFREPDAFANGLQRILAEQQPVFAEELELADGRIFQRDYIPLFTEDRCSGHLWKYADITRRKQAGDAALLQKEKYQRIIENINLGLLEVDLDDRIVYTNQSFCDMSGYTADELIGQVATSLLFHGKQVDFVREKNASRLKGITDTYEVCLLNKQGETMWWLISGAPLYSDTGDVIGSTGIHLDITKQKQLESELRVAKEAAEGSSRAKELFLANMSHEIRTPMNAILGLGQQLTKTTLTEHQQFLLGTINTAASNLLVILNDILDFSKIEAGQLTLEQIGFSLTDLLRSTVHVLTGQAEQKGLRLSLRMGSGMSPVVLGDPYRLNQILFNLLGNAIKFTETGNVTLHCQGYQQSGRQFVSLRVSDTGIGIDPAFKQRMFTKFTQEDSSIGRRYGGTGLGMSITKQLVDLMGGIIQVDSKPNTGTSVQLILSFPLGCADDIPTPAQAAPQDALLQGKRILLVEDNDMNRLVVRMILEPYGLELLEVTDGLKALTLLRQQPVDLVLMDVQMPVMDGLEATRFIRQEVSSSLPIIALTASAIRSEQEECYQAGMNDFLAKPYEEKDLIAQLVRWLKPTQPDDLLQESPLLYNLSKLEAISRGNREFIEQMVTLFCLETPVACAQMVSAYDAGDLKTIRYLAHRTKPSIDNLGIRSQTDVIRRIEELARTEQPSDELKRLIHRFDQCIQAVVQQMQTQP